jgi:hypothetical protein
VSINFAQKGWRVSARFPRQDRQSGDGDDGGDGFVFKGDYEGAETLRPPPTPAAAEGSASGDDDDDSSS